MLAGGQLPLPEISEVQHCVYEMLASDSWSPRPPQSRQCVCVWLCRMFSFLPQIMPEECYQSTSASRSCKEITSHLLSLTVLRVCFDPGQILNTLFSVSLIVDRGRNIAIPVQLQEESTLRMRSRDLAAFLWLLCYGREYLQPVQIVNVILAD